ncbi:DUF3800 domain-containing protein [Patescibacteria group bacterium]|nr:DUF3800 domain-containing protein [Patescibacteria group bacterium]MBU4579403.1 DUF3800 domain-containing protein [Patescibacteria group bacterium]
MYIFLDESYNLKDRTKLQFVSINGFETTAIKRIWKRWKTYRCEFVSKARIHATDRRFDLLREKALNLLYNSPESNLLTVFQVIQEIPVDKNSLYFKKGKLNFEAIYEDILKALLNRLNLQEYKKVVISIDSRKHKNGILGKSQFRENILAYLKSRFPNTFFQFDILPSSSNILLEVADFISNTFYKQYVGQKNEVLEKLKIKTIQIKNPLN